MSSFNPFQWRWPLSAFLVWTVAWMVFVGLQLAGGGGLLALIMATMTGVIGSAMGSSWVRRLWMALGFPLSWFVLAGQVGSGVLANLPAWAWLLPLGAALLLYPPATWRDAPLFPTPEHAFDGLANHVPLPLAGHVLDAGCGLGHGLIALERAYPEVHLHGIEYSWPLRLVCALWARHADVRQGDMWARDWSMYDLVYVFQRPESMVRVWAKAQSELRPSAWLASLEFSVPGVQPTFQWTCPDGRVVWLYRQGPDAGPGAVG